MKTTISNLIAAPTAARPLAEETPCRWHAHPCGWLLCNSNAGAERWQRSGCRDCEIDGGFERPNCEIRSAKD